MRPIVRVLCGSHLYGANVGGSDRDYKIVYMPSAQRILLQEADRLDPEEMPAIVQKLKQDAGLEKDPDVELISFRQYLKLLCEGQPNALDIFFAPRDFHVGDPEPEWYTIKNHANHWISRNSVAFVEYCRAQVRKYAVKVEHYNTLKEVVDYFAKVPAHPHQKIWELKSLDYLVGGNEHIEWVRKETAHGAQLTHLSVCQTMVPVTATCKTALTTFSRKLDTYGARVQKAANLDGEDWKSLYHAVRVAEEALELMQSGELTFPRPERNFLKAIRLGKIPFERVEALVEENLRRVEKAVESSALPDQPDWDFAERLVESFYRSTVVCSEPKVLSKVERNFERP